MNSRLYLTNDEATNIATKKPGGDVLLLRIMDDQPLEGFGVEVFRLNDMNYHYYFSQPANADSLPETLPYYLLPYKPGKIGLTETWDWAFYFFTYPRKHWLYKADGGEPHKCWRSGVTMPSDAIRHWLEAEITCVRLQELSIKEMCLLTGHGYAPILEETTISKMVVESDFIKQWNDLHAKPVKSADGSGWVCYPWDMESFVNMFKDDKRLVHYYRIGTDLHGFGWTHKPLTILPADKTWVWKIGGELHGR